MEKILKSMGIRILAPILSTVTGLGLAISVLAVVFYSGMGGAHLIYQNLYEDIADGYALYAVDMIEAGKTAELETYLTERGIACTVTKQLVDENQAEIPESQTEEFACGEVSEESLHQIELLEGAFYHYNVDTLLAALFGNNYYHSYGDTISAEVESVVFDKETGYFYYETADKFFKVEDIIIYHEGVYTDYSLTKVEGEECYYNGYYKQKLDTTEYELWDSVRINDEKLVLAPERGYVNTIYVTTTSEIEEKGVGNNVTNATLYYVDYYPTDYVSTYRIQVDWNVNNPASEESVFSEWYELYQDIVLFEKFVVPSIAINFILFVISIGLLMYSTINEKEEMGLLHKAPVAIYTGTICFVEFLLLMLLLEGIPAVLMNYGRGSVDVAIVLVLIVTSVILWLAIVWFQNIITRLKCRSFWRTTEIYYAYKLIKSCWGYITKPIKWCWGKITAPFRAVAQMLRENTPLLISGVGVFGVITIVELMVIASSRWNGDGLYTIFLLIKIVEVSVLCVVLFQMQKLQEGSKRIASGDLTHPIDTSKMVWEFKRHGENLNNVSQSIQLAVNEQMKSERFKTELITNVSHDIKTPLTSIINYVDLIKKEEIQDEKLLEYVDVLDRQSARLKKLIEDLMEASKASTGNLAVHLEECDVEVLLAQMIGEFEEKLQKNALEVVVDKPEHPIKMMADGRHIWRVLDNLLNNACKYSMPGTRVYVSLKQENQDAVIVFKNISKVALNIPSEELMERFVRGDSSRNTEGSGLGLSIAQSLTELMHGTMKLEIDGDLFKVTLRFPTL